MQGNFIACKTVLTPRRVEPPALGDSTIPPYIATLFGLVDTTKERWDPPYD